MTSNVATQPTVSWQCPVCGSRQSDPLWRVESSGTENGVDPAAFRPSTDRYGETVGAVVRCRDCRHGSLRSVPDPDVLAGAYESAEDEVSAVEEEGQAATASRSLELVERHVAPGRLVDVGCWTGSFVAAAAARGWQPVGLEPSGWAVEQAVARGLDVRQGSLDDLDALTATLGGSLDCVVLCDVIEHLVDVRLAVETAARALRPGGVLYLTTPDAGSAVARLLGSRWWSILPMHVQYFTRASARTLLASAGFEVVATRTHPKVFTTHYYAERLRGYSPRVADVLTRVLHRVGLSRRLVGPDFRDRMQIVAVKR